MDSTGGQAARDLVVIGGSAGGVDALKRLLSRLPADLPAAVCVALHLAPGNRSVLPEVLRRATHLEVVPAADGAPLRHGTVHVALPDAHLVVVDDDLQLGRGPRENGNRPSVDALLRSAALARGARTIGVVLTGMLDDGAAGLAAVARYGGAALVQDPAEADFPSMPRHALEAVPGAKALRLEDLADEVVRLVTADAPASPAGVDDARRRQDEAEARSPLGEDPSLPDGARIGVTSPYSCPDCGGVLNEVGPDGPLRFRCRVGHAHTAGSLLDAQSAVVEAALWTALRALDERRDVALRLMGTAGQGGRGRSREQFAQRAQEAARSSQVLRAVLAEHRRSEDATADARDAAATATAPGADDAALPPEQGRPAAAAP